LRKKSWKERISDHLYLFFNAGFLSGIIFIGAQVLLSVRLSTAFYLSAITFPAYLLSVYTVQRFVTSRMVADYLNAKCGKMTVIFASAGIIASVTTFLAVPASILVNVVVCAALAPPKYYFYAVVMALIVFLTTIFHFIMRADLSFAGRETLERMYQLQLELVKAALWAIPFTIFGTAYVQVLTGAIPTSGEMILFLYTSIGVIAFILVPAVKQTFVILDKLGEREQSNSGTF